MNIGLYGLPTSGKDTLINKLNIAELSHLSGSGTLKYLSKKLLYKSFDLTSDIEKEFLRKEFIKYANNLNHKHIIVDGHYSFMDNIVYLKEDEKFYDVILYLNTNIDVIYNRIKESCKNMKFTHLTKEQLVWWCNLEINRLKDSFYANDKEFVILDNDEKNIEEFILKMICQPTFTSHNIAKYICDDILYHSVNKDTIIITDCDKTLSKNDVTIDCFNHNNQSMENLNNIFKDDNYSLYQFWKVNKYFATQYSSSTICDVGNNVKLNTELVNDILYQKNNGIYIVGLTSGINDIWNYINDNYKIFDILYGGNFNLKTNMYVNDFVKGYVVKLLKKAGKRIISIGDSLVDILMLISSDIGIVYAPDKLRDKMKTYILDYKLYQLEYNKPHYNEAKMIIKLGDII